MYLVLTRGKGEKILLSGGIEIVVVEVKGDGRVQLGIHAPPDIKIAREIDPAPVTKWKCPVCDTKTTIPAYDLANIGCPYCGPCAETGRDDHQELEPDA